MYTLSKLEEKLLLNVIENNKVDIGNLLAVKFPNVVEYRDGITRICPKCKNIRKLLLENIKEGAWICRHPIGNKRECRKTILSKEEITKLKKDPNLWQKIPILIFNSKKTKFSKYSSIRTSRERYNLRNKEIKKLLKLELIHFDKETGLCSLNIIGVVLSMLEEITAADLESEIGKGHKFYIVKRKKETYENYKRSVRTTRETLVSFYHDKLSDLRIKGFKKDVFVEELANQMKIKDTDIVFSFMKAKKSFDSFGDFIRNFILFLGQWDEDTFFTKIIWQYLDDYPNKEDFAKMVGKKYFMLIDFQKQCHQYYLKKYKSPMESFDTDLFPREYEKE